MGHSSLNALFEDGYNKAISKLPVFIARNQGRTFQSRTCFALGQSLMTRKKRYSTQALANRLRTNAHLAAEYFQESQHQKNPSSANNPSSSGQESCSQNIQSASLTGMRERRNSSPTPHSRRFLSIYEDSIDVFKTEANNHIPQTTLQLLMGSEDIQDPMLPHFYSEGKNEAIPRISQRTFLDVLDGKYEDQLTQRIVIDCRFRYEFEGGHIDSAIDCTDTELLTRHLFETPMEGSVLLILHCEFSAHRAPMMARHIRSEDRAFNTEVYPRLSYPDVYILDGGYSEFFIQHHCRCYPQSYVGMNHVAHVATCEREMGKLQQKRKGTGRAKTSVFGARDYIAKALPLPTALSRNSLQYSPQSMIGHSSSVVRTGHLSIV